MKKLLIIPLLLFSVSAFGQFTKPELYQGINTNIRLKGPSQTRLASMLDSIVVSMGSGGVTDHGALTGLSDDDHTQYHNDARGDARYPLLSGGYVNPSFITSLPWSKITSTPTTIAGYGITDFNSLGDARWWALGGNSTLTSAVTINGSSSNHDITIGDTNEIGTFRVQSIGGIYLSNAVSTYSGAFRLGSNGNVGFDHSYFKIPASGYGVELGNTPIGGGVKLSSGSNAGQLEIGKYTGTNGDNPYVKFDLTVASDATGDTYYRNSSGYFTRLPAGTNGHVLTLSGGIPSWASPSTLSDGDKGDITVNGGGTNWTIDNSTVTLAKMANMATSSLIYRKTAGTGAPEVNTLATLKTDLGLTGTNSGDQTSIVGITGTTSQFNTALSDDDFLFLNATQTNSGAKTFLDNTLLMRNVANTNSSRFTNTNTSARTYTLPNVSGNVLLSGVTLPIPGATQLTLTASDLLAFNFSGTTSNDEFAIGLGSIGVGFTSEYVSDTDKVSEVKANEGTTRIKSTDDGYSSRLGEFTFENATAIYSDTKGTPTGIQYTSSGYETSDLTLTSRGYVKSGTATLTNKTINLTSNTFSGTTSQFNTALSDNDFATLLGSETLSNKTLGGGTWWSSAPTITDGLTITFNPNGTQAGFNFGSHASNPSVGNPGDGYYNSTDNDVMLNDGNWRPAVLTDKVQTLTNKTISPTANTIRYPTRTQSGTSYTIQASDENYIIQFTSASAIAVTLPDGLSTNFNCTLMNYGGGVITVTAATTLNTAGSANTIETQYTGASFQHVGSNVWDGVGALGSAGGGSGDVVGPASSTNNNVVFFDGTTGKLIKDSGLTLSGTNTGDQTTITGNAGTATTLQTARTIGIATGDITSAGSSFNGSANNTNAYTIANDAVTYAKMQNVSAASKLIGRGDSGSGDPQEITIGSGLTMTGTTLSASGGGGISNTAANNELMKSDGTNAIPSGLYSISAGDFYLGNSGLAGSSRSIVADGSASNVELYFQPKGTSPSIFKNGISAVNNAVTSSLIFNADEGAGHGITSVYNSSTSSGSFKIKGANGVASYTVTGQKTEVLGGNAYTVGNNNGGDVNIEGGVGNGTGTKGVVTIGNEFVFNHTDKTLNIDVATSTPPTPAANTLSYFARKVGGRTMPAFISPSGLDTYIQSGLARNKIALASPNGNSTTITSWGIALTATGTATAANVATTNLHTQMKRLDYLVTTAATTAVAGFRSNAAQYWRGNAAGRGGWHMVCRWGPATGVATSTNRAYVGLGSASAPTDVEPSSQTNIAGMGWDAADTNIQFMHNDGSGTASKIDLGASFPVPTSDRVEVYEIAMFCAPNGSEIFYEVTNLATGDVAAGSVTTDLIVNTTLVAPRGYMSVGGTSSVIGITLMSLYLETDY